MCFSRTCEDGDGPHALRGEAEASRDVGGATDGGVTKGRRVCVRERVVAAERTTTEHSISVAGGQSFYISNIKKCVCSLLHAITHAPHLRAHQRRCLK